MEGKEKSDKPRAEGKTVNEKDEERTKIDLWEKMKRGKEREREYR